MMYNYEEKHHNILRENLAECMVLLKKNGNFPLDKKVNIDLFGNGARKTISGGTGSGEVNTRHKPTLEQSLIDNGFNITSAEWLDKYDNAFSEARQEFIKDVQSQAKELGIPAPMLGMGLVMPEPNHNIEITKHADTALYVLSRVSGEGSDRHDIEGDLEMIGIAEAMSIVVLPALFFFQN